MPRSTREYLKRYAAQAVGNQKTSREYMDRLLAAYESTPTGTRHVAMLNALMLVQDELVAGLIALEEVV